MFLDSQVFSFHRLAYEAGSGRGNCCPSDIEAGRHTTSRDPYPIAEFQSDSKKMALAEAQTSFCVHLSVCLCLSQALFSSAQMISISLSFFFFLSPSLECQPQASQSQQKSLQAEAAVGLARSPHMVSPMLSEPHIYSLEMTDSGSGLGGGWHF